jgi:ABC-2 type transport system permease protein
MGSQTSTIRSALRIIGAIAAKDITDALKNRGTLTSILMVLVMMALYKGMPLLHQAVRPNMLVLYDLGHSRLAVQLEESPDVALYPVTSLAALEQFLGSEDTPVLGLMLPPDVDQALESQGDVQLTGTVDHWVSDANVAAMQASFERQLSDLIGKPVRLQVEKGPVYTQPDGGHAYTIALMLTLVVTMVGLFLVPYLVMEERETKTLNALLLSPAGSPHVAAGKALAGLFYCLVASAAMMALSTALVVHWGLLLLAVVLASLLTVALGLLLGSLFEVRQQMGLWAFVLAQPLILPAAIVPTSLLPERANAVLGLIPTVALSKIVRVSLSAQAPWAEWGWQAALVAAWIAVLLAAVSWRLRRLDAWEVPNAGNR